MDSSQRGLIKRRTRSGGLIRIGSGRWLCGIEANPAEGDHEAQPGVEPSSPDDIPDDDEGFPYQTLRPDPDSYLAGGDVARPNCRDGCIDAWPARRPMPGGTRQQVECGRPAPRLRGALIRLRTGSTGQPRAMRTTCGLRPPRATSSTSSKEEPQVDDLGFLAEPPDGIEPSTYALRVRRSSRLS